MKIAVIAASGRSGQVFVEAALAAGHEVRAGIMSHNPLTPHKNLTIVHCDATSESDLRQLLSGQDAVVSLIGHGKKSPVDVQTHAMRVLIVVMKELGLKRLVSLTGTGVRLPGDHVSLMDRFLNTFVRIAVGARVTDGIAHTKVLQDSNLDWTIIRVLLLTNSEPHAFLLKKNGPTKWSTSRREVALAIVQVLEQNSFVREAPIIGRP